MSEENVEIVRRVWAAADRRDSEAVFSLYDPDVELDVSGFPIVATNHTIYRGHTGLRRLFHEWREIWSDADSQLIELVDAGAVGVVSIYTYRARGRGSGAPTGAEFATVWTIKERKVVRVQWFIGRAEALEAAGLSE